MNKEEKAKAYDEAICDFADIQDYEGLYKINKKGEVLSVRSGKFLKAGKNKQGYMNVVLSKNGESKVHKVHRLVAKAFIPNPNNYSFINHKDEDKTNNCVENLEWCTAKYNINYGTVVKKLNEERRMKHCWSCYKGKSCPKFSPNKKRVKSINLLME